MDRRAPHGRFAHSSLRVTVSTLVLMGCLFALAAQPGVARAAVGPDLGVAHVARVPEVTTPGAERRVLVTVRNRGTGVAAPSLLALQLQVGATGRFVDAGSARVRALAPGRKVELLVRIVVPHRLGLARLATCVDVRDVVVEADERNQCARHRLLQVVPRSTRPRRAAGAFGGVTATSDLTWRVLGTAAPDAVVTMFSDSACTRAVVATVAAADGTFAVEVPLARDVMNDFWATSVTAARTSRCAELLHMRQDSTAPATPSLVVSPGPVGRSLEPVVGGTGSDRVLLHLGPECGGGIISREDVAARIGAGVVGEVHLRAAVAPDTVTTFSARAVDEAGNASPCSAPVAYEHDQTPPAAPGLLATTPNGPSRDLQPVLTGTAPAGSAMLELFGGAACTGSPFATLAIVAGVTWRTTFAATPDATTVVSARYRDAAGNEGACSDALGFEHDGTAPATPQLLGFSAGAPLGYALLDGSAEVGSEVLLYAGISCTGLPVAWLDAAAGTWQQVLEMAAATSFVAAARDAAGNVSACSAPLPVAIAG